MEFVPPVWKVPFERFIEKVQPEVGGQYDIPVHLVHPTQLDDGVRNVTEFRPLEVYEINGRFDIIDGNHRYYDALDRRAITIPCILCDEP